MQPKEPEKGRPRKKSALSRVKKAKKPDNRTQQHKKAMLSALRESLGIVTTACLQAKINRWTHYDWMLKDPAYAKAVNDIADEAIDYVESKMYESIEAGSDTMTIFFLKTKGKSRGYVEKTESDVNMKGDMKLEITVIPVPRPEK